MMMPLFDPNLPLQLRKGTLITFNNIYKTLLLEITIKMELIIFANLYQAKEGLIFYVHFFIELRGVAECKGFGGEKFGGLTTLFRGHV